MTKHIVAQHIYQLLRYPVHGVAAHELAQALKDHQHQGRDGNQQDLGIGRLDNGFTEKTGKLGSSGLCGRINGIADHTDNQHEPVGPNVTE